MSCSAEGAASSASPSKSPASVGAALPLLKEEEKNAEEAEAEDSTELLRPMNIATRQMQQASNDRLLQGSSLPEQVLHWASEGMDYKRRHCVLSSIFAGACVVFWLMYQVSPTPYRLRFMLVTSSHCFVTGS